MVDMAIELEKLNDSMEDSYVLVVAGRLGSSDNWLGIPCAWSQISKAHVIVETGLEDLQAEPSEGTHFFQNMTSFNVGYMNIDPWARPDDCYDAEALDRLQAIEETDLVRHIRLNRPLEMYIDGFGNKGFVGMSVEG
jgi:hypothetical protein